MSTHERGDPEKTQRFEWTDTSPEGDDAVHAQGEPIPPGTGLLVVRRGPNAGHRYLLEHEVETVGRHPDSSIFLDDVTVSRRHAEFRRSAGRWSVMDAGALNGISVNRERIEGPRPLNSGDEVQIGKFRLVAVFAP